MINSTIGNKLSFKTYSWLKVNDVDIEIPEIQGKDYILDSDNKKDIIYFDRFEYGISEDILELNNRYNNLYRYYDVEEGEELNIILDLETSDKYNELIDLHDIIGRKNSKIKLILDYSSVGEIEKFRSSIIRVLAEENSEIDLFIIQLDGEDSTVFESIIVNQEENSTVNIYQYELGSSKLYTNFQSNLIGDNSTINLDGIYFGYNSNELNMLYNMVHHGKNSISDIKINGALKDNSFKNLKSTLDFREGSSLSSGSESEYTILLDNNTTAISVPVLLAHEDNIEGNHAASSGKIDQDLLFYIKTRGFSEEEAQALIVQSRFSRAISSIENEEMERILRERVEEIVRS